MATKYGQPCVKCGYKPTHKIKAGFQWFCPSCNHSNTQPIPANKFGNIRVYCNRENPYDKSAIRQALDDFSFASDLEYATYLSLWTVQRKTVDCQWFIQSQHRVTLLLATYPKQRDLYHYIDFAILPNDPKQPPLLYVEAKGVVLPEWELKMRLLPSQVDMSKYLLVYSRKQPKDTDYYTCVDLINLQNRVRSILAP